MANPRPKPPKPPTPPPNPSRTWNRYADPQVKRDMEKGIATGPTKFLAKYGHDGERAKYTPDSLPEAWNEMAQILGPDKIKSLELIREKPDLQRALNDTIDEVNMLIAQCNSLGINDKEKITAILDKAPDLLKEQLMGAVSLFNTAWNAGELKFGRLSNDLTLAQEMRGVAERNVKERDATIKKHQEQIDEFCRKIDRLETDNAKLRDDKIEQANKEAEEARAFFTNAMEDIANFADVKRLKEAAEAIATQKSFENGELRGQLSTAQQTIQSQQKSADTNREACTAAEQQLRNLREKRNTVEKELMVYIDSIADSVGCELADDLVPGTPHCREQLGKLSDAVINAAADSDLIDMMNERHAKADNNIERLLGILEQVQSAHNKTGRKNHDLTEQVESLYDQLEAANFSMERAAEVLGKSHGKATGYKAEVRAARREARRGALQRWTAVIDNS